MLLTRFELDRMAATFCDTGLLRSDPAAEPIILRSRCHPDAPALSWMEPIGFVSNYILALYCSECRKLIVRVALAVLPKRLLACRECGEDEVWASYRHASGRLRLECHDCGRTIATLAVRSDAN